MTLTEKEAIAAGAIGGGIVATMLICGFVVTIIMIIAWWKIFKKAGLAGWKSLIPFYNMYCLYRISGLSGWWFLLYVAASIFISSGFNYTVTTSGQIAEVFINPAGWIGLTLTFGCAILQIVQEIKLADNFGRGIVFKICSVFFTPITTLILGFGSDKYDKKSLHD
ncbi:MAG: DUF5684 domain-containing protein [Candidatus Saccharibacteria bacterium]|nr:DUF5684 domain-containing protein [Candidatus Saccharibacteria bacterium]